VKGGENMPLTMSEKVKIILNRRSLTISQLAELTGQSRQNMSNKMSRDNFSEKELHIIAEALNCKFEAQFIMNDTGEKI
jgi:transcriptional regulator with XRE-family HTH domain